LRESVKIKKIRGFIKVGGALAECKEYLDLIHILRYGKTKQIIEQIDDVSSMLESFCKGSKSAMSQEVS
jgi:hypothetical protein